MEKKNCNLPEAIRLIVTTYSKGLLLESRVVNILTDYNAFKEVIQARFILKSIISEGYADKLLSYQGWDDSCDKLIERFIQSTGLQANYVNYVFACLSYGLGWTASIPDLEETKIEGQKTKTNTSKSHKTNSSSSLSTSVKAIKHQKAKKCEKMTDDEFEEYIWSKIEWDHNLEKKAGLTFSNYQISEFNFFTGFKILFEVKGSLKTDHLCLEYTAYDNKGRLRANGTGSYITNENFKNVREMNVFFNKPLDTLGKVLITASYHF